MVQFLDRFVTRIESPSDVMGVFAKLTVGQQHHLNRAMRAWFKCLELSGLAAVEQLDPLRKVIPKDPVMIDTNVPEDWLISYGAFRILNAACCSGQYGEPMLYGLVGSTWKALT